MTTTDPKLAERLGVPTKVLESIEGRLERMHDLMREHGLKLRHAGGKLRLEHESHPPRDENALLVMDDAGRWR